MILTVTMNPSVDIAYPMDEFKLNDVNRVSHVKKTAGGKGLNVTRVISHLEETVLATGVIGGTTGEYIRQELNKAAIPHNFLPINQESRNCIAILHDGMQTEILESGPVLSEKEADAFLAKFDDLLSTASLVTISGSLPSGLLSNFYYKLIDKSHEKGIRVILDTSGEALKQCLLQEKKPFLIKPNLTEIAQLLGVPEDRSHLQELLCNSLFKGIEWIVVSLGSKGAFVKHRDQFYDVSIPKITAVNPVGSGDAAVAGLAVALDLQQSVENVLKTAMTTGILNTLESETGKIHLDKFGHYFHLVEIKKLD